MEWSNLLSTQRFKIKNGLVFPTSTHSSQEGADVLRTDFHIDYDRVVFSGSFRRLGRKTQVHPFAEHDHTHNRLTHSVEVACVGRSLGNQVGMMMKASGLLPEKNTPSDIGAVVQVACLAHDMGNPPFGHTGEAALRDWFTQAENQHYLQYLSQEEVRDIQTYEGNAHSLRIVADLEMYRNQGGMRLTAASIGALLKYPWTSSCAQGQHKFNIYQAQLPFITSVAEELGLPKKEHNHWARHPLSYLMEAADDICYALLDLEDAVEIGMLHELDFEKILSLLADAGDVWPEQTNRQRCARLRGIAIGHAIGDVAHTFLRHHHDLLAGNFQGKDLLSLASPEVRDTMNAAKELAKNKVFQHQSKIITEIAAFPCLASILSLLIPATCAFVTKKNLSARNQLALSLLSDEPILHSDSLYTAYMKVLDFVGGMTDNAAAKLAREVSGIGMIR